MKKRLGILAVAAITAMCMMIPSFADVPDGVEIDIPNGWTMTEEMKTKSHTSSMPEINYSYDIGRVQVQEDSTFESVYISYYVDSALKGPAPELKGKDASMAFYESIGENIRKDILRDCNLGQLLGEFEPIKMKTGEYAIYSSTGSEEVINGLIIQPMGDGVLRVFNILGETEDVYDKLLAAACSYGDSNDIRNTAVTEIDGQYENAAEVMEKDKKTDKNNNMIFIILIAVIILAVVFFTTMRNARKPDNMVLDKYDPSKDPEKVPVEVTCSMCGKKFIVYALEGQEKLTRKNTDRCPECEAPVKNAMKISGRLTPWR